MSLYPAANAAQTVPSRHDGRPDRARLTCQLIAAVSWRLSFSRGRSIIQSEATPSLQQFTCASLSERVPIGALPLHASLACPQLTPQFHSSPFRPTKRFSDIGVTGYIHSTRETIRVGYLHVALVLCVSLRHYRSKLYVL